MQYMCSLFVEIKRLGRGAVARASMPLVGSNETHCAARYIGHATLQCLPEAYEKTYNMFDEASELIKF